MRPWSELELIERPALDEVGLRDKLLRPAGAYAAVDVVRLTSSTHSDLVTAAMHGAADRTVLFAEEQTSGRGRNPDRVWLSPPRAGLYCSVLFRPADVPFARLHWLVMLAGVAVVRTIGTLCGVPARLKWPNDLLVGPELAKCGGILAEVVPGQAEPTVALGIGVNVFHTRSELPVGPGGVRPTSLLLQGAACLDRQLIAEQLLTELDLVEQQWRAAAGNPIDCGLADDYRSMCATLGQQVKVELPADRYLQGFATDIDLDGRLLIRTADGQHSITAGDIVHLRQVMPQQP